MEHRAQALVAHLTGGLLLDRGRVAPLLNQRQVKHCTQSRPGRGGNSHHEPSGNRVEAF